MKKNKSEISKPITLVRAELISNLTNTINNSSLPAFVIEPILRDLHSEVRLLSQRQAEEDKKKYFAALEKANDEYNDERLAALKETSEDEACEE